MDSKQKEIFAGSEEHFRFSLSDAEVKLTNEFESSQQFRKHMTLCLANEILNSQPAETASDFQCRAALAKIQAITSQMFFVKIQIKKREKKPTVKKIKH